MIGNIDAAIEEQSDLVRELERTPECAFRAVEAQNVLSYMEEVRNKAIQYKDLQTLLNVQ